MRELPEMCFGMLTGALKITETSNTFRKNANWSEKTIKEIYRQAESGGVLLSSMGTPRIILSISIKY